MEEKRENPFKKISENARDRKLNFPVGRLFGAAVMRSETKYIKQKNILLLYSDSGC
ncbi:MAG: hypothetical protein II940_02445 [Methanosarcinaceae archaeon]|nr:hypothetical protein [Methanosarcinaceae archaeon]